MQLFKWVEHTTPDMDLHVIGVCRMRKNGFNSVLASTLCQHPFGSVLARYGRTFPVKFTVQEQQKVKRSTEAAWKSYNFHEPYVHTISSCSNSTCVNLIFLYSST
jgi:hypothetical protein